MSKFKKFTASGTKGRSPRQLRMGEEIRHALANAFQLGDYPWPQGQQRPAAITVTEVRISPDMGNATAYVVPLGGPLGGMATADVVKTLNLHRAFFKNVIAKNVVIRYVPALHFDADTSFDYAEKIEKILHDPNVARDLKNDGDE
jgi:ribosome-binding factor A